MKSLPSSPTFPWSCCSFCPRSRERYFSKLCLSRITYEPHHVLPFVPKYHHRSYDLRAIRSYVYSTHTHICIHNICMHILFTHCRCIVSSVCLSFVSPVCPHSLLVSCYTQLDSLFCSINLQRGPVLAVISYIR